MEHKEELKKMAVSNLIEAATSIVRNHNEKIDLIQIKREDYEYLESCVRELRNLNQGEKHER